MKKIGLSLLSLFVIFGFGVSFANPIAPETYYVCSIFENIEIDNYRIIAQNGSSFYEPTVKTCSQCGEHQINNHDINRGNIIKERSYEGPTQKVFLLDKTIKLEDITTDNVDVKAIPIGSIISTFCDISYNKTRIYKVVNSGGNYTMLNRTQHYRDIQEMKNKIKKIPVFRLLTIIIETIVLFFIAKIVRKDEPIPNKKLLLFGIIPTTITLPLLWFILPLLLGNGTLYSIIGESLVIVIEMTIIKYGLRISREKAIITSIICNIFSFITLSFNKIDKNRFMFTFPILLYLLIEPIILILIGKLLRKRNEISNTRIILVGTIAPIINITLLLLFMLICNDSLNQVTILLLGTIILIIEMFIIKYGRKIPWREAIITGIICNLFFTAIIFIFLLTINQFYD